MNTRNRRFRRFFGTLGAGLALVAASLLAQPIASAIVVARTAVAYRPRPVARAAVATTAVVATAVAVGTIVNSVPPSCSAVMVGNVAYQQCGSTWYQPRYSGSQVTYVVVNPPQ
jgi:hypothetical protein